MSLFPQKGPSLNFGGALEVSGNPPCRNDGADTTFSVPQTTLITSIFRNDPFFALGMTPFLRCLAYQQLCDYRDSSMTLDDLFKAVRDQFQNGPPNGWLLGWDEMRYFELLRNAAKPYGAINQTSFDYGFCNWFDVRIDSCGNKR